ncbi:hypothetical protein SRHO_G00175060 [Serrasalmus rhombeus]
MVCLMASVCGMWSVWNVGGEGAVVLLRPAHTDWINMGKESGRSARGRDQRPSTPHSYCCYFDLRRIRGSVTELDGEMLQYILQEFPGV